MKVDETKSKFNRGDRVRVLKDNASSAHVKAEPAKSPIQTITATKVIGGRYGMVEIIPFHTDANVFQITTMAFSDVDTTPQRLRAAAELFVELADHLDGV